MTYHDELQEFHDDGTVIEIRLVAEEDTVAGKIIKLNDDSLRLQVYKVNPKSIKPLEIVLYYLDDIVEVIYNSSTTQKIERYLMATTKAYLEKELSNKN